jgi:N-glycosylase/DNA lyase
MIKIKAPNFNLQYTLECGQFFHYTKLNNIEYLVIIKDNAIKIKQQDDILYINKLSNISEEQIREFFNLDIDYISIIDYIIKKDPNLENIISKYWGLRIINQDITECIFSFILSSFNSIKKVQMSVNLLSSNLGHEIENGIFAFPKLDILKDASDNLLYLSKTGFRGKYIKDTAKIIFCNNIDLYRKDYDIKKTLMSFPGIGDKISDCIMLYSYKFYNVFPKDIWILRFLKDNKDYHKRFKHYAGWAQVYIYSNMRYLE